MLIFVVGLGGCSGAPADEKIVTVSAIPPRPISPSWEMSDPRPTKVTAPELYRVYSHYLLLGANPDQRFLNRLVLVSGTVEGVQRGPAGHVWVELGTHDAEAFAYAEPSAEARSALEAIAPGSSVTLLCRGDWVAAGSPMLRDCRLP